MIQEDAILLPEIVDAIFLVAIHPASQGQHEEVQSVGHGLRLRGSDTAVTPRCLGIHSPRPFLPPYEVAPGVGVFLAGQLLINTCRIWFASLHGELGFRARLPRWPLSPPQAAPPLVRQ